MSEEHNPLDLDAETMRELGYRAVDALVARLSTLDAQPAWRGASRTAMDALLREPAPEEPRAFDELMRTLTGTVFEHAGRIDHPRFFAFVPSSPTWPGILGDFLASGYNVFQGTWLESAGPSALELVVLDWFRAWLGMPAGASGLLVSGGSAANLTALVCAREARLRDAAGDGVVYVSREAHSSLERALRILAWPHERVRVLDADERHRLPAAALRDAIEADVAAGRRPFLAIANAGATSTGAVDPLGEIADVCARHGVWLHVDAAYGGFAVLTKRGRELLDGIGRADSVTLDPHKWLFQNYEAGCLLVRDAADLHRAFHIMHPYLQDTALAGMMNAEINFADRGIQLSRAARAVKIWLSLNYFGLDAFRRTIDRALDLALEAEAYVRKSDALELLTPAELGIVCFRCRFDGVANGEELDARNARLVAKLADSGVGMISSTRIGGRYALRLCIMNHRSGWTDVEAVLRWLERSTGG